MTALEAARERLERHLDVLTTAIPVLSAPEIEVARIVLRRRIDDIVSAARRVGSDPF